MKNVWRYFLWQSSEREERKERNRLKEMGSINLNENKDRHRISSLTIIGEIEGREAVAGNTKATKYEHLLPMLAEVEDSEEIEGVLILPEHHGGDVEAGLSIAEMIASLSKAHSVPGTWRQPLYRRPISRLRKNIPLLFQAAP